MSAAAADDRGRVFMCYRRDDAAYPAGWLFERLASHLGRDKIFHDVDSIELGDDFAEVISRAVGSCDVLLVLIGNQWLTVTDPAGRRRLDDPSDFVRLEIEAALARNVLVIPVLVGGARMPQIGELPASLARLARRQALELSPVRFESDTARLLKVLDKTLQEVLAPPPSPLRPASGSARPFASSVRSGQAGTPAAAQPGPGQPRRPAGQRFRTKPGLTSRGTGRPARRPRFAVIALAGGIIAAAIAIPLALATSGSPPAAGLSGAATGLSGLLTGTMTAALGDPGSEGVTSVAFGPGGTLAVGDADGSTYLWDTATRTITATLTDPGSSPLVNSVAFGPGGTLAAGDSNGSTYLWNIATRSITATLHAPGSQTVNSVAFGPNGTVAVGDANGSTYLWDTATRKLAATFHNPHGQEVNSVAFGPSDILAAGVGNPLHLGAAITGATASGKGATYLWDIATRKIITTLTDLGGQVVISVAFGPQDTAVAAGDSNGSTYLWQLRSQDR
jgi:TIR domain/WD domain, G-beta repeat